MKIQSFHRLLNYFLLSLKNDIKHFIRFIGYFYKYPNVKFHYSTVIYSSAILEGNNALGQRSRFEGYMGYGSYIQDDCNISGKIGRFTSIAPNVKCNRGVHPTTYPYVSTSPVFYSTKGQSGHSFTKKQLFIENTSPISIGNDCWIGQNVFIVGGITIGDGAIVLANATVTKDIPPYAIVGGVPAKIIKYRYNEEVIEFFLRKKWWDKPIEWLEKHSECLCDITKFKKEIDAQ